MKKLLILLALATLSAGAATAQVSPGRKKATAATMQGASPDAPAGTAQRQPPLSAEQLADRYTQQLGLSAEQREQLLQLEQTRRTDAQTRRAGGPPPAGTNRADGRQTAQARQQQYEAQLKGIFTPDQYARYTQLRQERQEQRGNRRMQTQH
ncbi:hypothetical protein D0N36_18140 [Hymenobacter lapidiphilus]|uniref:hypothetical protein n=1 Tax=Hymenobacter sp. CCM 8763 TaxID=2303334 RepID=UPI000E34C88E|nr:hypothetical protein [Hymenobacter sp. CCM 8763]RFP63673.1 hypothetical protein D0N36_18140 [Hymenobacter sp. CCM 8763]